MLKRYNFWLTVSIVFLLLTGAIHATSFLGEVEGQTDAERTMIRLMTTEHLNLGAGFTPTFMDLFNALSSCFSLAYILGGLTLIVMIRKKANPELLKGILAVYVVLFGICFVIMFFLTFLPPIVVTGLTFISLTITWLLVPKNS